MQIVVEAKMPLLPVPRNDVIHERRSASGKVGGEGGGGKETWALSLKLADSKDTLRGVNFRWVLTEEGGRDIVRKRVFDEGTKLWGFNRGDAGTDS